MHVAAQAVQFGHHHRTTLTACLVERSGKLGATFESVDALASLYLNENPD
jgi:hypothetical protein